MAKKENKNENKLKKHFFKDFKAELKKVIWPTPKQLVNNTVAVVTIVLITAVIVFALDAIFDLGNKYGITQLQNIVDEKFSSEETDTTEEDASTDESTSTEGDVSTEEDTETEGDASTDEGTTTEGDTTGNEGTATENTDTTTENSEQ